MAKKLLGVDVGTGGTRAVLLDEGGRVLNSATAEHAPMHSPQIGWAEQDPQDWWRAGCRAIKACLEKNRTSPDEIAAVGLTGQMHGLVLLDAEGKVLRPSIIWCDQRTGQQCEQITERIGAERLIELTANPALTNFTLPKIWWVQQHEPEIWSRARAILLPKDYFRFRLTGARAMDVAEASGTLLFDVSQRKWSKPILEASGISESLLPTLYESPEISGAISKEGAARPDCSLELRSLPAQGTKRRGRGDGNRAARRGERHDRDFRCCVCGDQPPGPRSARPYPHFLSRAPGTMACDGRHPGRRAFAALVSRQFGAGNRDAATRHDENTHATLTTILTND